jgi:2-methylcitrate dehydratase PrpD
MGKTTETIVNTIVNTDYASLHKSTVLATKRCILDCLGVALAGSKALGVREVVDLIGEIGGLRESRIWFYGTRAPAGDAAFANSVMSHALDYDDSYRPGIIHPTCSVLPAALSICERVGGKRGRDLVLGVCLGNDIACRLASVLRPYDPYEGKLPAWRNSAICGAIGCVFAVGKLLNFSPRKMRDALGIVYSQVAGNKQCEIDGAAVKRMQPGFMAKAAVFSCLLAERGVTGAKEVFDGPYGFFEVYGNKALKKEEVLEGIGKRYLVEDIGFKIFPCCGLIQAPVEAALELRRVNRLRPEDVKEIKVVVPPIVMDEVGKEYVVGDNPRVKAQFNLSYNVATAMIAGDVTVKDYVLEAVIDPARVAYSKIVDVISDPSLKGSLPVTVEIRTLQGGTFSKTLSERKGDIARPLSDEELCRKFYTCVDYLGDPEKLMHKGKISEMILSLEQVDQLDELVKLL